MVATDIHSHRGADVDEHAQQPDEGQGLDEADVTHDLEIKDATEADGVKGGSSTEDDVPVPGVKLNHSERVLP